MPHEFFVSNRAYAPPVSFQRAVGPFLKYSKQCIHYAEKGWRMTHWSLDRREYLFERLEDGKVIRVKMTRFEYRRLADVWNAYFYGTDGGNGPTSSEFKNALARFTQGRVTDDMVERIVRQRQPDY